LINVDFIDEFRLSWKFNADADSFYFLKYVVYVRKYCDGEKNQSCDFDGHAHFEHA
jgi:hypothetical protein